MWSIKWTIRYSEQSKIDLKALTKRNRKIVTDAIERHLEDHPFSVAKHRHPLKSRPPQFDNINVPVWKLTVDPFRVIYVLGEDGVVEIVVLLVFNKGRKTLEEAMK